MAKSAGVARKVRRAGAGVDRNNTLLFRIAQTANLMHKTGTNWSIDAGLTTQQWVVLGALSGSRGHEGIPVGQFSEFLLMTRQNLNSVLGRLEKQGLTARVAADPDARVKKVVLTAKGRVVWEELDGVIKGYCGVVLKGFTEHEKIELLRLIDKLRGNLVVLDKSQVSAGTADPD